MARYIDAELALTIIDNYAKTVSEDAKVVVDAIRDIVKTITPTADVVEVVRCKDCVLHEEGCPLDTHPYMTADDGYCYLGKRTPNKEEE